jgi:hypothetical protein
MRRIVMVMAMMCELAGGTAQAASDRFSGGGTLVPGETRSADGRFAMKAELQAGDVAGSAGRFTLDARLVPGADAKATLTACGASMLFANGFE